MLLQERKKVGFFRSCIVPILGFVGFILLCFVFCEVIFLVGSPNAGNSGTGSLILDFARLALG